MSDTVRKLLLNRPKRKTKEQIYPASYLSAELLSKCLLYFKSHIKFPVLSAYTQKPGM